MYLEDKATGVFTLMNSDESVYTFTSEIPINGSGRFFIHTSSETLQTNEVFLSNITIFTSDDKLQFVNLPQGKKSVKMYSLLGKLILDDNLENKDFISTKNISKALYIVRLETEKGTINQKIILE